MESAPEEKFTKAPAIKTFKSDVAHTVQSDHISIVKMALAESHKREEANEATEEASPLSKKNLAWIISSLVLLVIGFSVLGYFYFKSTSKAPTVETLPIQTDLIFSESSKDLPIKDLNKKSLLALLNSERDAQLTLGTILKINIASSSQLSATDFLNPLYTRMPPELQRSLDNKFFLGVYAFSTNDPFLILTINNYETSYSGMLAWEKDIRDDVGAIFTTSNATSSAEWIDKVIENKDTRVLTDIDGKTLFFYSFIDKQTLVFATNANSFKEILIRINKPKLIH